MTNCSGDYIAVSEEDFRSILECTDLSPNLLADLKSRFFVASNESIIAALDIIKTKYYTKRSYLNNEELLLMVVPTIECNSECVYCQASSKKVARRRNMLSLKTALAFCDFVSQLPHKRIKIEFQGGEPTLAFDLIELISTRIKRLISPSQKEISYVICTNLLFLSDSEINFIKDNNIAVSTSLDGSRLLHNINRPAKAFLSPYDSFIENLDRLRQKGIYPSALVTITAQTIDRMEEIIDSYIANGFTGIFLRPLNRYGYAFENDHIDYSDQHFIDQYRHAIEYIIQLNLSGTIIQEEYFNIILRKIITPFNDGFVDMQNPCALGSMCLMVDQTGDIYPSDEARMISEMGDHFWCMGSVNQSTAVEAVQTKRKEILRTGILETYPGCTFCPYVPYCSADPIRSYYIENYTHDSYCGLKSRLFDLAFSFILSENDEVLSLFRRWANV